MGWERIRAWFKSLKPGSDEEILSWEFGTLSEEPELEYNHRRFVPSNEVVRSASTSASTLGFSSERDVLDAVRKELHEETKPILEIFHLSQTYLAGEGPVLPVPSPALSEAEGVVEGSPVEGPVDVLQGFSLQVRPGEFVSILDPTPVGQVANLSYLLSLIGGLSRPTRGAVYLEPASGEDKLPLPRAKAPAPPERPGERACSAGALSPFSILHSPSFVVGEATSRPGSVGAGWARGSAALSAQ